MCHIVWSGFRVHVLIGGTLKKCLSNMWRKLHIILQRCQFLKPSNWFHSFLGMRSVFPDISDTLQSFTSSSSSFKKLKYFDSSIFCSQKTLKVKSWLHFFFKSGVSRFENSTLQQPLRFLLTCFRIIPHSFQT